MSQALATRVVTIDAGVFIKSTLVKGYQGLLQKSGSNSERDTHNHQERSRKASVGKTPIDRALRRAQKSLDDGDVILSVMLLTKLRGRLWWALATGDVKTLTAEWNADFPSPRGVDVGLRDLERLLRETKRLYRRAIEAYYHWADEHPHDYMAQNRAWFKGMAKVFGWTRRQAFQIDWPKPRCLPPLSRIRTEREAA